MTRGQYDKGAVWQGDRLQPIQALWIRISEFSDIKYHVWTSIRVVLFKETYPLLNRI